jgi:hypothetical protein
VTKVLVTGYHPPDIQFVPFTPPLTHETPDAVGNLLEASHPVPGGEEENMEQGMMAVVLDRDAPDSGAIEDEAVPTSGPEWVSLIIEVEAKNPESEVMAFVAATTVMVTVRVVDTPLSRWVLLLVRTFRVVAGIVVVFVTVGILSVGRPRFDPVDEVVVACCSNEAVLPQSQSMIPTPVTPLAKTCSVISSGKPASRGVSAR